MSRVSEDAVSSESSQASRNSASFSATRDTFRYRCGRRIMLYIVSYAREPTTQRRDTPECAHSGAVPEGARALGKAGGDRGMEALRVLTDNADPYVTPIRFWRSNPDPVRRIRTFHGASQRRLPTVRNTATRYRYVGFVWFHSRNGRT